VDTSPTPRRPAINRSDLGPVGRQAGQLVEIRVAPSAHPVDQISQLTRSAPRWRAKPSHRPDHRSRMCPRSARPIPNRDCVNRLRVGVRQGHMEGKGAGGRCDGGQAAEHWSAPWGGGGLDRHPEARRDHDGGNRTPPHIRMVEVLMIRPSPSWSCSPSGSRCGPRLPPRRWCRSRCSRCHWSRT